MPARLADRLAARWAATDTGPAREEAYRLGERPTTETPVEDGDTSDDEEYDLREKWNSGPSGRPLDRKRKEMTAAPTSAAAPPEPDDPVVARLKEAGSGALGQGRNDEACALYTEALTMLRIVGEDEERRRDAGPATTDRIAAAASWALTASDASRAAAAALFSNRSLAHHRAARYVDAAADGAAAAQLRPFWPKPCYRVAVARLSLQHYPRAVAACRRGEDLAAACGESTEPFLALLNTITVAAVRNGSLAGFYGRTLEVRSAGEDAWLGARAPKDPFLDADDDDDGGGGGPPGRDLPDLAQAAVDPAARANYEAERARRDMITKDAANLPRSFRSLLDAIKAARDGDRIVLLRGIHNTFGETCDVEKRILIRGEGRMEETTLDARCNTPVLRITASCTVQNVNIDMTGFRESLYIGGNEDVRPVFEHVRVKCSGDDAVNVAGAAQPLFVDALLGARKNGLRALGSCRVEMVRSRIAECGHSGIKVMDNATVTLRDGHVTDCSEDGVVAMDEGEAHLIGSSVRDNQGPGVDGSGSARVVLRDTVVKANVGGVWLWDAATAVCDGVRLNGGGSHAMLVDGDARARVRKSVVEGLVLSQDEGAADVSHPTNTLLASDPPTELPGEVGPFAFHPDPYVRKM